MLKEKITLLNSNRKVEDVQAILIGFLTYHKQNAEPWMYEALGLAIEMNKGKASDIQTSLNYATDLALRSRNPNHLVSVADLLYLHGYYGRVGALLDLAEEKVPHRAEPLLMSINLAGKTKDPKRMAAAVERLLSLGWPGADDQFRRDAHTQVERLAKALREDGRGDEADSLLDGLPAAEARDLYIRLTWLGDADLDLKVDEPLGATACFMTPRTVFGGSIVKNGRGKHPEDVYVCPKGFDGDYKIHVETVYNNPEKPALQATVEVITHEGTADEHKETHTVALTSKKPPAPLVVTLKGGRRTRVEPFLGPIVPEAPPQPKAKPKDAKPAPAELKARPR